MTDPRLRRPSRVPYRASVHLFDGTHSHDAELRDLSEGGAFLAMAPPLVPIGTGLTFWLTILGHKLLVRGHVRWTRSLPAGDGSSVGIGIEFYDPDGSFASQIRGQLERIRCS